MRLKRIIFFCLALILLLSSTSFITEVNAVHIPDVSATLISQGNLFESLLNFCKQQQSLQEEVIASQESEWEDVEVSLMLLGDVCLATNFGSRNRFHSTYDKEGPEHFFQYVRPYFERADYVIANIENVFTNQKDYQKGKIWTYKADTKYMDVIYESGITHVAVVNNHMHDYLQAGFDESVKLLEKGGIKWFGTNEFKTSNIELGNVMVDKKEVIEKDGFKIGLLSYYGFNTSYATDEVIDRDVKYLKEIEGVDYIISYVHWGGQGTYPITQKQTDYGRKLVDRGVDLVVGGHPHVVQTMEIYKGKHIYYSLGDFMFVHRGTPKDPDSIIIDLKLTMNEQGEIREEFDYIPVLWGGSSKSNQYTPKVGTEGEIERALKKLNAK